MKVWRYSIRGEHGSWAVCFLDETGQFAVSSSYGGFGYYWSHHGCDDFRKFFLEHGGPNDDYMVGKLGADRPDVCDERETQRRLVEYLEDKFEDFDPEILNAVEDVHDEYTISAFPEVARSIDPKVDIDDCDLWDYGIYAQHRGHCVKHFVTYLMPELAKAIHAEVDAERGVRLGQGALPFPIEQRTDLSAFTPDTVVAKLEDENA